MAIDNLNYYSSGLPAGQLTDKYSSNPGCLKSKNLDIFSSSKSVKGTAFSNPSAGDGNIVAQDSKGHLVLKTDGNVYEDGVFLVDPSVNFPSYKVSYNGREGTYTNATRGTVKDMVVQYEGDEWKSFVVFTDRASYTYSKVPFIEENKSFEFDSSDFVYNTGNPYTDGYLFKKPTSAASSSTGSITIKMPGHFANVPIRVEATQYSSSNSDISLYQINWYKKKYYYDPEIDQMASRLESIETLPLPQGDIKDGPVEIIIPESPYNFERQIELVFKYTTKAGSSGYGWTGDLYIDLNNPSDSHYMRSHPNGDYNEYYSYLSIDENRKFVDIGEYYWHPAQSYQTLYNWEGSRTEIANREKKIRYDFVQYMGWANEPGMDVIGMVARNEQIYMIGNMNGNGYIIPCDLTGGRGTPYIAYGCTFKGVANIDYLLYLVGEDRGVSQLWVYNSQELVPILGGNKESEDLDLVGVNEQYRFDGRIVNYKKNLILTTEDGRIFEYGQTYGGKGGAFIHQLPENAEIKELITNENDLIVKYNLNNTVYSIIYQDDVSIRNYNTVWEAVYPIVLGNHLLEKEESDLYCSFILPSASTSLEFWGMANHYHFWTFTSNDDVELDQSESYKMTGATGEYELKFIERNGNQYTFRLEGDLPVQDGNEKKITDSEDTVVINYSDFNHFRKIGIIETDKYWEGEFRFHNLNNKLELPRSHSLQIMVKGKGTADYTPELFSVDLVANQRERG